MCCASRRTGSRPSTKSTSATSRKTPQPASSSACLSGPGPSTSRSIAWRSRRTDLGRQQLAGAERIGVRVIYRATYIDGQDSGAVQLPRVALGLLLKFGHPATRRWGGEVAAFRERIAAADCGHHRAGDDRPNPRHAHQAFTADIPACKNLDLARYTFDALIEPAPG